MGSKVCKSAGTAGFWICALSLTFALSLSLAACSVATAAEVESGKSGFEEGFDSVYREHCAVCHGDEMQGSPQGPALVGIELRHGSSVSELISTISEGVPTGGMPGWQNVLSDQLVQNLAIFIAEQRENLTYKSFFEKAEIN